jgi:hypothetical protein
MTGSAWQFSLIVNPRTLSSVTSTNLTVFSFLLASTDRTPMGAFMSTLAEISSIPFILCLILGAAKHIVTQFSAREWSAHLPDCMELLVMWAVYVWLSNLFSSRITYLDESDVLNLLAIFLVCLSVALFRAKDDQAFHP